MPEPGGLRLRVVDGETLVTFERTVLYRYDSEDTGMRNLAIVALTDAGRRVSEVAAVFGLTPTYVSMLRGRARSAGSAGLVRRRGRPPRLSERQVRQARGWLLAGWTQQAVADRFGVARSVISELRARLGPLPVQDELPETTEPDAGQATAEPDTAETAEQASAEQASAETAEQAAGQAVPETVPGVSAGAGMPVAGSARIGDGSYPCRYAGATLLHAYLARVGAEGVFATLTGGPARRYDDLAVLSAATLGFALGTGTVEGAKHLRRADAGAAAGLAAIPEVKTLRARLSALADGTDPLATQRAFAAAMLAADPTCQGVCVSDVGHIG